jgi:tyrosine-protein kinase Etk/Wzc
VEKARVIERQVQQPGLEGLSLRDIKSKIKRNWHWFVVFSLAGMVMGFAYNRSASNYYKISSTILITSDAKTSDLNNIFRQLNVNTGNPVIQDQVGVLRSFNLNLKTMEYFNWRYSWYKKDWTIKKDLYGNDPFVVEGILESIQTENVPLRIVPISETQYRLSCNTKVIINGVKVKIEFENRLTYGSPFKNKYFQFSLKKRADYPVEIGDEYILVFNNISQLALTYKENLKVKPANDAENSNIINLELITRHLERDVDYLNQLGKIYIQFGLDEKNRIANNTIKFIDDQITGVNQSLQLAGDQFTNFRTRNRTVDLGQEATSVVEKLKLMENERANLDLKLEYYRNLKFYLENRDQNKDLVAPSLVGVTDEALNAKVFRLNELYVKREVLSYTAQERNPVLISLTNEINYTQKSLKENIENLIANTRVELQNLNERQGSINSELSKLPKTEQDLIGIKRNFDLNNELYTFLLQRRAEAEIAKASNNPDARILDPTNAEIALLLGPILILNLLIGLVSGVLVALSVVIVKELVNDVLTDVDEISARLDVAVIGSIVYNKYNTEMAVHHFPRSALTESFRGLRVNLEHLCRNARGNVLAVHSYISGEGKSFVAINLAMIFSLSNRNVLLVDGDLRKPRLHKILTQDNKVGLSNFLEGEKGIQDIIRNPGIPNLHFVAAGVAQANASELLSNGLYETFIEKVREQYDYVIIDNSPIGVVYDPLIIGAHADFNLILLRLNHSKRNEINAINKIGQDGILKRVIVAVNGIKPTEGYGYYTDDAKAELNRKHVNENTLIPA